MLVEAGLLLYGFAPRRRDILRITVAFLLPAFFVCSPGAAVAGVWYVSAEAAGANNGNSWSDAFNDLHDALAVAQSGDEIWVAAGTYKPDRGTGDRTLSFKVPCGSALYGGLAGWEECLDDRDWAANETILSGDLNGDDGPQNCQDVSNCCQEHEGLGCDDLHCQEIVCQAQSWAYCCDPLSPQAWDINCATFAQRNCCHLGSWGVCDNSYQVVRTAGCASPTVLDGVTVLGAYYDRYVDPYVPDEGAGVFSDAATMTIARCKFRQNSGSGINAVRGSRITLSDCSFYDTYPGGSVSAGYSDITAIRCGFFDRAGGLQAYNLNMGTVSLRDCSFIGQAHADIDGNAIVDSCVFEGNSALLLNSGQSTVTNCSFVGNRSHLRVSGGVTVDNCAFIGSTCCTSAVSVGFGSGLFRNCAFLNNYRGSPALSGGFASLYVLNSTIVGNALQMTPGNTRGGGIDLYEASAQVLNSIIWGNGSGENQTREEDQLGVRADFGATLEIDYSIVEGWSGRFGGDGNFGADPLIANLFGPDGVPGTADDDARLSPGSPAIDAGFPSVYLLPTDLEGHSRQLCGAVDIGAYEFGIGDFNCNQLIDMNDFAIWPACMTNPRPSAIRPGCEAFDFDADGDIDLADFYGLQRVFAGP